MSEFHKQDTNEFVYFYEQEFYVLSNFSAFKVLWRGIDFQTLEHAYQWEKFPHNSNISNLILQTRSAHDAFKMAEIHKINRRPDWDEIKVSTMHKLMWCKFDQHEYVREKLRQTGTRKLIEDSWRDDFWGWGPNKDGRNMCGCLWMTIRMEAFGINF